MRIRLSLLFSLLVFAAAAQSGFYGKKHVLDFSVQGRVPFFNNMNAQNTSLLNAGLHLGFSGALNNSFSMGFETDYMFNSFASDKYLSDYRFDSTVRTFNDKIQYRSFSLLFRIEIHERNFAPFGVSHQIAIGPTFNTIVNKDYKHSDANYYYYWDNYNGYVTGSAPKGKMTDGTVIYTINTRTALTRSLWLNVGLRTSMHLSTMAGLFDIFGPSHGDASAAMAQAQLRNIFNLKIGLSYAF